MSISSIGSVIFYISYPLAVFETRNGTIHTGVTLNLLTVIAALQYCIVGLIFILIPGCWAYQVLPFC